MGFLGGIGKALGGVIKNVAPKLIQAVAPAATKLLKGIVGDAFQVGGAALKSLAGRLPGPLGSLAQNLLGKFLPKLQSMAQGGIEGLINKLANSITNRLAPGAGNVALPPMTDPSRTAAITNPANAPSTSSTSAPATSSAPSAPTSSSSSAATSGSSGAPNTPPEYPSNPEDIGAMKDYYKKSNAYQAAMSAMQNHFQMLSTIAKSHSDLQKQLISNLR